MIFLTISSTTLLISMTILEMMAKPTEGMKDSLILIQIRKAGFLTPIGMLETLTLIMEGNKDTQVLRIIG